MLVYRTFSPFTGFQVAKGGTVHSRLSIYHKKQRMGQQCTEFLTRCVAPTTRTVQLCLTSDKARCSTSTSLDHESSNFSRTDPRNQQSPTRSAVNSELTESLRRAMCGNSSRASKN